MRAFPRERFSSEITLTPQAVVEFATAAGDNNADPLGAVTVDFSQFGGGSAVPATNGSGTWTATYTLTAGSIDASNRIAAMN